MIRDLYRANFNLRQSSYFVPLLIAHGKHFYEILSCSIGRQEDWSHYLLWGSLPAVWLSFNWKELCKHANRKLN